MRMRTVLRLVGLLALVASLLPVSAATAADFDVAVEDFQFNPDERFAPGGRAWHWMR